MNPVETGLLLGRIPYIKGGAGTRTAVVFFGANALFQRLDRTRPRDYARMVENVLPAGHAYYILGYEADPPPGYTFDRIVDDFARIVRDVTGKAVVIGVSFGGFVAQRFAAEHPDLVDKLVLLVSAHRYSNEGLRKLERQEAYMRRGDLYGFLKDMALLFRRPWYNWMLRMALWQGRHKLAARLNDPRVMLRTYESLFRDFENASYARRIAADTLIVGGTGDQFFDAAAFEETAQLIPSSRLRLFHGETHMLPIERRADVREAIARFLDAR